MTVVYEKDSAGDKILKALGKKRAYKMPKKLGEYDYARGEKESLISALLRPKGEEPPDGWFYFPGGNDACSDD